MNQAGGGCVNQEGCHDDVEGQLVFDEETAEQVASDGPGVDGHDADQGQDRGKQADGQGILVILDDESGVYGYAVEDHFYVEELHAEAGCKCVRAEAAGFAFVCF